MVLLVKHGAIDKESAIPINTIYEHVHVTYPVFSLSNLVNAELFYTRTFVHLSLHLIMDHLRVVNWFSLLM